MIYIVAGVSGCGKSTVGSLLADNLSLPFYDGDDYHPESNKQKMAGGTPLTDDDRWPWLTILGENIVEWESQGGAVVACSALLEAYRRKLATVPENKIKFIFLTGDKSLVAERIAKRSHEFYNNSLLDSQYELLDVPDYGLNIDIDQSTDGIVEEIMDKLKAKSLVGLIGLGVMGKSLALNIARNNFAISVYNRHVPGKEEGVANDFVAKNDSLKIQGYDDLSKFVESLAIPRSIILMVNAGKPVDALINALIPLLDTGDTILDTGNSLYTDTIQREKLLADAGINFFGVGVSGGEEGALKGPSIMPGGNMDAYKNIAPILEAIAAKDKNGNPCVNYIGPEGSGHFVKMIHNGIEYAEMQLIAEVYQFLRFHAQRPVNEIIELFTAWQKSDSSSYLLEITIEILKVNDGEELLVDKILDKASGKGTGGWSTKAAIDLGMPIGTISEALMARIISSLRSRAKAFEVYGERSNKSITMPDEELHSAYQMARIINHAIGFDIILEASNQYRWNIDLAETARIWTNGCIIRSALMEKIAQLGERFNENLLLNSEFVNEINPSKSALIGFVTAALSGECAIPVHSTALNYFLAIKTKMLPANLIQAQRDYFGAHTYQRVDKDPSEYFHTVWKEVIS